MLLFTDPVRTPDPVAVASGLPKGAGVVFRPFGATDALRTGRALARVCRQRGLVFLVGADAALAARLAADGVHLPERMAYRRGRIRDLRGRFIVTAAAHSLAAARRADRAGVEAIIVSPIFPSRSPSAGRPLGLFALTAIAREVSRPVYALGGINADTARGLKRAGAAGFAAIEALSRT
jgi:thiamine-phosphate pyrophosphorylase